MLTAAQLQRASTPVSYPTALAAPVTGWNTRDALDRMDPTDAVNLDNWFPYSNGCDVRTGSASWATGLGAGNVQTLCEYFAAGTRKMLGACAGSWYDVSSSGAVGSALASGFANNQWQTTNWLGKIFFFNGVDTPQSYDGSTFGSAGWSGTGLTVTNLMGALGFKTRLYCWEKASQNIWYSAIDGVTGALTKFPLGDVIEYGGNVLALSTLSYDGGDGLNDYLCIFMTTGEVIIYNGFDPATAGDWSLVGRYYLSAPLNVRAIARYGADIYVATRDDYTMLSGVMLTALKTGVPPPKSKISGAAKTAAIANGAAFGWQIVVYTNGSAILVNVPNTDGSFSQHVYSTQTQAWCRFNGLNAYCWSTYNNKIFFGGANGIVYQWDTGYTDSGAAIVADGQTAWTQLIANIQNTFNPTYRKRVAATRLVLETDGPVNYSYGLGYDYQDIVTPLPTSNSSTGSPWDVSPWDVSPWSPEAQIDMRWRISGGTGQSISVRCKVNAMQPITWLRTDMRVEQGKGL